MLEGTALTKRELQCARGDVEILTIPLSHLCGTNCGFTDIFVGGKLPALCCGRSHVDCDQSVASIGGRSEGWLTPKVSEKRLLSVVKVLLE